MDRLTEGDRPKCPECGAKALATGATATTIWDCGSANIEGKRFSQSITCKLAVAERRIAKLEKALAGPQCPRCAVDGYWHRACQLAEARIAELETDRDKWKRLAELQEANAGRLLDGQTWDEMPRKP